MRWLELLSAIRLGSKKSSTELARSPFHKDYDRIIFSQSFRQLNRKTQVHPLTQHDGIHTRLTHSLEVSCIGRSLGMLAAEKIKDHAFPCRGRAGQRRYSQGYRPGHYRPCANSAL